MKENIVFGVGINDAGYIVAPRKPRIPCPFYRVWHNMITRCYSARWKENNPTYSGCTVSTEWHRFSTFKIWMERQNWQGNELDKDLISPENKVYGADTCVFIHGDINKLIMSPNARGYSYRPKANPSAPYAAMMSQNGSSYHIGYFRTEESAGRAYMLARVAYINAHARHQPAHIRILLTAWLARFMARPVPAHLHEAKVGSPLLAW